MIQVRQQGLEDKKITRHIRDAQTIWWLVLRICLTPIAQAIAEQKRNQSPSVSDTR